MRCGWSRRRTGCCSVTRSSGGFTTAFCGTSKPSLRQNSSRDVVRPDSRSDFTGEQVVRVARARHLFVEFQHGGAAVMTNPHKPAPAKRDECIRLLGNEGQQKAFLVPYRSAKH